MQCAERQSRKTLSCSLPSRGYGGNETHVVMVCSTNVVERKVDVLLVQRGERGLQWLVVDMG